MRRMEPRHARCNVLGRPGKHWHRTIRPRLGLLQAVEAFSQRMADHGIVTLTSGGEAVHLDRKLDDADNYSEMVNRLAKDYIDWWMLSKVRLSHAPVRLHVVMHGRPETRTRPDNAC